MISNLDFRISALLIGDRLRTAKRFIIKPDGPKGVRLMALSLAFMQICLGITYLGPEQFIRRPSPSGQASIVVYIESLGPYWPAMFLISGAALLFTALQLRRTAFGHALSAAAWTAYGTALLIGPILTVPPAPIVVGVIAILIAPVHVSCIIAWKERGIE
nr:hypothetical protein [Rhodococcus sp. (in: high G+C Gram-positive bacteria)]